MEINVLNIKKFRQKINKTQKEVADDLNMQRTKYARIESKQSYADYETLIELAKYFRTTIDSLLGHEVPYLLDKSLLSDTQNTVIKKLMQLSEIQSQKVDAYITAILDEK